MRVYHSGGEASRCDANCHEAKEPACDCCCGGRLHGRGSSERAIEVQTADLFRALEEAEAWTKRNGIERAQVKAPQLGVRRRLLVKALAPYRVEERRQLRLGIVPGQLEIWPNP